MIIKIISIIIFIILLLLFDSWFCHELITDSIEFNDEDFYLLLALLMIDVLFVVLGIVIYSYFFNGVSISCHISGHTTPHIIPIPHSDGTVTPIPVGAILNDFLV